MTPLFSDCAPSDEGALQKGPFGNFEIMNDPEGRPILLGKGTFGRTYQARHCFLDTIIALKIITGRYVADAAVRERFLTEARAVAKLSHPHIARLYDFGEMDGVLYYAEEYCGGGSLADYVAQKGAVPLGQTIEIGQQMSGALKCAHTAGFIHGGLKPSNIMLTASDGPLFAKLIDFGLVQPSVPGATGSFGDDQSVDGARFLGTPLFASPEQLREEPMDVRTDLFSLGMTLWFLMEGRAPESGFSAEIAASRLDRESYGARLPANLPPLFRDVLARLLEKDRKNRFATAAEVFKALNACAAALGFRRARDYNDLAAELEWERAEANETSALDFTKPQPAELESVDAELSAQPKRVTREQLPAAPRQRQVFVSYSAHDLSFVETVVVPAIRAAGFSPWYSLDSIRASANWEREILKGLQTCELFVVVMSLNAVNSDWVRIEVHWATQNRNTIIPLMISDCDPWQLHMRLGNLQYIDFRKNHDKAQTKLFSILQAEQAALQQPAH
jgi:serine/threonine protein kinase